MKLTQIAGVILAVLVVGSLSNLGEGISSLTPGGDAGQPGNAGNGPADGSRGR